MRLPLLLAAAIAAGACFTAFGAAHAQPGACAEDDLKCRIAALERRLDDLTARQQQTDAKVAAAPPPAPALFSLLRACHTNCEVEAVQECVKRGYSSGKPKDWERPRSGPVMMTRIACTR